jgi:hypothetical protein
VVDGDCAARRTWRAVSTRKIWRRSPFEDRLKARLGRVQLLVQAFPQFRDFLSDQWLIA